MNTYKMVITAYFRAEDSDDANMTMDTVGDNPYFFAELDSYTVNPPVEVHSEKDVGISE